MTVYLGAAKGQSATRKIKIVKKSGNFKFPQILCMLLGIIIVLGLVYGIIANKVVTTGYNIRATEKMLNDMKDKNDELKIMVSELKSVRVLENKIMEIGMIEPGDVDYMSIGKEVALRGEY